MLTAKEYLEQIRYCEKIIVLNNGMINDKREQMVPGGAIDYSADRVQTSPSDCFAARMAEFVDDIKALEGENDYYKRMRSKIIDEIKSLSNHNYIDLLYKRYVEGKRIKMIADEKSYTYSWTRHLHRLALNMFEKEILCKNN